MSGCQWTRAKGNRLWGHSADAASAPGASVMRRATHMWRLIILGQLVLPGCGGDADRKVYIPPVGGQGPTGGATGTTGGSATGGATNGGVDTGTSVSTAGGSNSASATTGGRPATGGALSTGGTFASGGTSSLSGTKDIGGVNSTGGTPSTGGAISTGASPSTGGSNATGGKESIGGSYATGERSTGGAVSTGSSIVAGGSISTGGLGAIGGTSNTGGSSALSLDCIGTPKNNCVSSLALGFEHTCALVNGGVWCWGDNAVGELGNDSGQNSLVPVPVPSLTAGVSAIAAMSSSHTCALVSGAAWCWGNNFKGQLGNNSANNSPVPVPVQGLSAGVQSISVAGDATCAIVNGAVYCWGDNYKGQLGYDTGSTICSHSYPCSTVPAQVLGLSTNAQAVATGGFGHTCALLDGAVKCWGDNQYGQLGDGTGIDSLTPVQVSGLTSGVASIIAGSQHSCALMDGALWCWGANGSGQIGDATDKGQHRYTPVRVIGLTSSVQAMGAGSGHNCVVTSGHVLCWGDNSDGQLGNIVTTNPADIPTPVQVYGLTAGGQGVGGGTGHSCAIVSGAVKCWGWNSKGQLGNNSTLGDSYDVTAGAYVPVDAQFPW